MIRVYFILSILFISQAIVGQVRQELLIKGKVIDSSTGKSIPFAQIASYRLVQVFAADSSGRFNILTNTSDSLKIFAIGYDPLIVHTTDTIVDEIIYEFRLKKQPYMLNQVDVHPWDKDDLDKNLNLPYGIHLGQAPSAPIDVRSDVGGKPPIYAALTNPISFGYYYLSKKEKKKRQLNNVRQLDNYRNYMTNELLEEISGLKGQELSNFRVYCNTKIHLGKRDTDQTVRFKVLDALTEYNKLNRNHEAN